MTLLRGTNTVAPTAINCVSVASNVTKPHAYLLLLCSRRRLSKACLNFLHADRSRDFRECLANDVCRAQTDVIGFAVRDTREGLGAQAGHSRDQGPLALSCQNQGAQVIQFAHVGLLVVDETVPTLRHICPIRKTHLSDAKTYDGGMDDMRQKLASATAGLIGDGKRFRSARELAQRAHTLGYVDNADSFARNVARVMKADHDTQMSTVEIIARTAGMKLPDFLSGNINPANSGQDGSLSGELRGGESASLQTLTLTQLTDEMRDLIEHLVEIDHLGGADREMAIAGIRYILRGHLTVTGKK